MTSGEDVSSKVNNLFDLLESFKECILSNHSIELWTFLNDIRLKKSKNEKPIRIDIVLDNCGIELASDLILCDFLLRNQFVDKIFLHAKAFYWFISGNFLFFFQNYFKEIKIF